MEEDVLGTRRDALGNEYVQCTRCGRWFPRQQMTLIPPEEAIELDETQTQQIALCPDCKARLEERE